MYFEWHNLDTNFSSWNSFESELFIPKTSSKNLEKPHFSASFRRYMAAMVTVKLMKLDMA